MCYRPIQQFRKFPINGAWAFKVSVKLETLPVLTHLMSGLLHCVKSLNKAWLKLNAILRGLTLDFKEA